MNEKAVDDASKQGAMADGPGAKADRGGAAAGFSWKLWQEKLERLCRLGEMCADDESTLKAFKRRVGWEGGQAERGDGGSLLTERAVLAGVPPEEVWQRRSSVSLGGACRMMVSADGVVAVNLPRDDDWQMLPALFGMLGLDNVGLRWDEVGLYEVGRDYVGGDEAVPAWEATWQTLESAMARLPTEGLVCAAGELGLAVAEVGSSRHEVGSSRNSDILAASPQTTSNSVASLATVSSTATSSATASSTADSPAATFDDSHGGSVSLPSPLARPLCDAKVVDLSVMWAGPLCGDLLARAGAQVVKVESSSRPDGARRGLPEFYELLNGKKQHRSIGFDASKGRAELLGLFQNADIVITSCRPRALEQMGIDPRDVVKQSDVIWAGITGYGWEQGHKVAFGDDAAAAGGLVDRAGVLPSFIGDAIADPLTGVTAAAAVMEQWLSGTPGFLDISMVGSAAFFCEED